MNDDKQVAKPNAGWVKHYSRTRGAKAYGWEHPKANGGYATLPLPGALHVNSVQPYAAAGLAGVRLIQAALPAVRPYLESGALVDVLKDFRPEPFDVALVVAHRTNLSRRVRAVRQWI